VTNALRPLIRSLSLALALVGAGCGSTVSDITGPGTGDAAVALDMAVPPDLASSPDLRSLPDLVAPAGGACTSAADEAKLGSIDVAKVTQDCATSTFGQEPATSMCIKNMTGLSDGCVACFTATIQCTIQKCIVQCAGGNSTDCQTCRAANCDPDFAKCSGLQP
jgi:hypothetical protein